MPTPYFNFQFCFRFVYFNKNIGRDIKILLLAGWRERPKCDYFLHKAYKIRGEKPLYRGFWLKIYEKFKFDNAIIRKRLKYAICLKINARFGVFTYLIMK